MSLDTDLEAVYLVSNRFDKLKHSKHASNKTPLKSMCNEYAWFNSFEENWNYIENKIMKLFTASYRDLHNDIVEYLKWECYKKDFSSVGMIPMISIVSGTSSSDYVQHQFDKLLKKVKKKVTKHAVTINPKDVMTKKQLLDRCFQGFMKEKYLDNNAGVENTMDTLQKWYYSLNSSPAKEKEVMPNHLLVVIMPNIEQLDRNILLDFIMILSDYCKSLPVVLVCGLSTCVSIQKMLPFHATSKMMIKMFQLNSILFYSEKVLEDIFLNPKTPFHVSGKAFRFLVDMFLSYNLSIQRLVHNLKFIMMEHYYNSNIKVLCCAKDKTKESVSSLNSDDLKSIRSLNSFRKYASSLPVLEMLKVLKNEDYCRMKLEIELLKMHDYMHSFFVCLKLFFSLIKNLPENKLGNLLSEIYIKCALDDVTKSKDFKNCMQLLRFQSKVKLEDSIRKCLDTLNEALSDKNVLSTTKCDNICEFGDVYGEQFLEIIQTRMRFFLKKIEKTTESRELSQSNNSISGSIYTHNRLQLKENLLKSAIDMNKSQSDSESLHFTVVQFLEEVFKKALQPPKSRPFYEIFFYEDITSIEENLMGLHKGSLHKNLCHPESFIKSSTAEDVPDICIAYKLYLEYGRYINMDDWLVAFDALLRPDADDENIPPEIVRRFKRVVRDMRHVGLIRLSRENSTHAARLFFC